MTQIELKIVARESNATHRLTMQSLSWERTKVATMSIRTRSLRENLFESAGRKDVFRFCKDVCEAHKKGKLQGKDVVLESIQDIFHNLIRQSRVEGIVHPLNPFMRLLSYGEVLDYIYLLA